MEVTVNLRKFEKGNLKGFVTATFTDDNGNSITVNSMKLTSTKDGSRLFVSSPSDTYTDKDGNKQYNNFVKLSKNLQEKLDREAINAYHGGVVSSETTVEDDTDDLPF